MIPAHDPGLAHLPPWVLLFASFVLVFRLPEFRRNRATFLVALGMLTLHHLVAIMHVKSSLFHEFIIDASTYHLNSETFARTGNLISWPVELTAIQLTFGIPYAFFGVSFFLGNELAVWAGLLSCAILLRMVALLKREDNEALILFLCSCLPSALLWSSTTYREPFQLLFLITSLYCFLQFLVDARARFLLGGIASSIIAGLFHNGLMLFSFFYFLLGFLFLAWYFQSSRFFAFGIGAIAILLLSWKLFPGFGNGVPQFFFQTNIVSTINAGRTFKITYDPSAKTNYHLLLDDSSMVQLVLSGLKMTGYYLFGPIPSWPFRARDIYAFMEALLRAALIFLSLYNLRRFPETRSRRIFLFSLYLILTIIWALATANFGTALRHHYTHTWMLVLLGL